MMRRHASLTAAAAAAALTLVACGGTEAAPEVTFGIHPQEELTESDLELMRDAGIEAVRGMVNWGAVEPAPGTYDWTAVDASMRELGEHGIDPVLYLYGAPGWAAFMDGQDCVPGGRPDCAALVPRGDDTLEAFAAFARAAVERYGRDGDFWSECGCDASPVTTWQIWNEPNSPKYSAPDASPAAYAALLQVTSEAIRGADPDAEIVLGGIWGPRQRPGDRGLPALVPVGEFLDELYRFPGIEATFDAVAVHPYSPDVSGVLDQVDDARSAIEAAGDDAALYVTEIGWASSGPPDSRLVTDEEGQAEMLSRTFSALEDRGRAFRLRGVFWYTWRDGTGAGICGWCTGAGLRTASGAPKPAWHAMTTFTGGSD
jgi:polysaccharide biosynthesis protein PslG